MMLMACTTLQVDHPASQLRLLLFRFMNNFHDPGIPRIFRQLFRANHQRCSPLIAPEITSDPGVFDTSYGSPVRYASSITPWPSSTVPSTGQISCGSTVSSSPMRISESFTSTRPVVSLRCATLGMRRANASSTDEARAVANVSSVSPPDSISTTIVATRYSRNKIAVTIETPASRSDPNSRLTSFFSSTQTSGTPPISNAAKSGMSPYGEGKCTANFRRRCNSIARSVNPAMYVSLVGAKPGLLAAVITYSYRTADAPRQTCNFTATGQSSR